VSSLLLTDRMRALALCLVLVVVLLFHSVYGFQAPIPVVKEDSLVRQGHLEQTPRETLDPTTSGPSCLYTATDGSFYDLTALTLADRALNFSTDKFTYYVALCSSSPACTPPSPVCQSSASGRVSCGTLPTQSFKDFGLGAPNQGVTVTYTNGAVCVDILKTRTTTVHIRCNPKVESAVITSVGEEERCRYTIHMESQFACPIMERFCQLRTVDGTDFDLRGIVLPDKGSQSYTRNDTKGHRYFMNICANSAQGRCDPASPICQITDRGISHSCGTLATQQIGAWATPDEPTKGVKISYSLGDTCLRASAGDRRTEVEIGCDLKVKSGLVVDNLVEPEPCRYKVSARSKAACPISLRNCEYIASDGSHYNLQGMYRNGRVPYSFSSNNYQYYINICGNVPSSTCSVSNSTQTTNKNENKQEQDSDDRVAYSPVCQLTRLPGAYSGGSLSTQQFSDYRLGPANKGVTVTYTEGGACWDGTFRQSKIDIACDPTSSPGEVVSISENPVCSYTIRMKSVFACPIN
jgi:hypothetical protein